MGSGGARGKRRGQRKRPEVPSAATAVAPALPGPSPAPAAPEGLSPQLSIAFAVLYGMSAAMVTLVNKHTVNSFDGAFALLALQSLVCLAVLSWLHMFGVRWVTGGPLIAPIRWENVVAAMPMAALNIGSVAASLFATKYVPIPLYTAVRRTGVLQVFVLELILLRSTSAHHRSVITLLASVLVVSGAVAAGWGAMMGSAWTGVLWALANNFFSAGAQVVTRRFSDQTGVPVLAVVHYNALVSLPVTLLLATATGELAGLAAAPFWDSEAGRLGPQGSFLSSATLGLAVVVSQAVCTTVNSPLATAITGNAKDVATTLLSSLLFRDFRITILSGIGLALSFGGSALLAAQRLRRLACLAPLADTDITTCKTTHPPVKSEPETAPEAARSAGRTPPSSPPSSGTHGPSTPEVLARWQQSSASGSDGDSEGDGRSASPEGPSPPPSGAWLLPPLPTSLRAAHPAPSAPPPAPPARSHDGGRGGESSDATTDADTMHFLPARRHSKRQRPRNRPETATAIDDVDDETAPLLTT